MHADHKHKENGPRPFCGMKCTFVPVPMVLQLCRLRVMEFSEGTAAYQKLPPPCALGCESITSSVIDMATGKLLDLHFAESSSKRG